MTPVASAPGKVMLAGEYAVLDGGLAVLVAVSRRARATLAPGWIAPSPFLVAARQVVEAEYGTATAAAFDHILIDTDALRDGDRKLGIGSSAAATVAAIGLACGLIGVVDPKIVHRLAHEAHAQAQGRRGAPGSGADVACSAYGGVIDFRDGVATARKLPTDVRLIFAWTGSPADTTTLVSAVQAARDAAPAAVNGSLAALAAAATQLAAATTGHEVIAAVDAGAAAMDQLAAATDVALVPAPVGTLQASLRRLGATAKTTGAGGGDVVLIAAPTQLEAAQLRDAIVASGMVPLSLAIDPTGVDFHGQDL